MKYSNNHAETPANPEIYQPPSSDRGSIKFLLNGGTDSFTETFRLPPRSDRALSLNYHNRTGLREMQGYGLSYNIDEDRPRYSSSFINSDSVTPQFFHDTFLEFFNGPFGDGQKHMEKTYDTNELAYQAVALPGQNPSLALSGDLSVFEPIIEQERPFAMGLIQSILTRALQVPLDSKAQEEVSSSMDFLLTTTRIRKFITLYFKYWQPSCAMLEMSFDPESAPLPLLAAVTFMGAMYSQDQKETYVAKRVLDFAELFIFSDNVFIAESEICNIFSGSRYGNEEITDWVSFQNLQAGLIIVIAQYWAGTRASRNRAMENRFSEVLKVARRMGLVKARHLPNDQPLEHLWIQKECQIRYMFPSTLVFIC